MAFCLATERRMKRGSFLLIGETASPAFRFLGAADQVGGTEAWVTFDGPLSLFRLTAFAP
jgi:hypothetical protein